MKVSAQQTLTEIVETNDYLGWLNQRLENHCVLLITSKSFTSRGVSDAVGNLLPADRFYLCDQVSPNPQVNHINEIVEKFANKGISMVLSIGGGSVIDTAKICSLWLNRPSLGFNQLLALTTSTESHLPVIAIPTTAGTGAEVTPFATAWDTDKQAKFSVTGVAPKWALLDPAFTLTLSRENTLYPAMDALSHALESLWNNNSTSTSQANALEAIDGITEALPEVLGQPDNLHARRVLLRAASKAGLAISETKTAIAHALSYPLTLKYAVPHGVACSVTLLAIIQLYGASKLNLSPVVADKVIKLLESIGISSQLNKYVSWETAIAEFDTKLDPSRAGNFLHQVDEGQIEQILQRSKCIADGELN